MAHLHMGCTSRKSNTRQILKRRDIRQKVGTSWPPHLQQFRSPIYNQTSTNFTHFLSRCLIAMRPCTSGRGLDGMVPSHKRARLLGNVMCGHTQCGTEKPNNGAHLIMR